MSAGQRSNAEAALAALEEEAAGCRLCPLFEPATQTVFGEGAPGASIMLVGEQPGDQEDRTGAPFVGPAGQVLDACLEEAGIDRSKTYVTNAVKHFKFTPRGKRRIHGKPRAGEIDVCAEAWLAREIEITAPDLLIGLGTTAIRGITGRPGTIKAMRGGPHDTKHGVPLFVTVHPSFLLRIRDQAAKEAETQGFVADLKEAGRIAAGAA